MIRTFFKPKRKVKALEDAERRRDAKAAYDRAKAVYDDADNRGDDREMGPAYKKMRAAMVALLEAERGAVSVRR